MEDGQRANSVFTEPDPSREGMSCGLDVEPEIAFREGQKQKTERKYEKITISNIGGRFGRRDERQRDDLFGQRL